MKIEISQGCTETSMTADGKDFYTLSIEEQKEIIIDIIKKSDFDMPTLLETVVQKSDNVEFNSADEPCEQCGHWWNEYILEV